MFIMQQFLFYIYGNLFHPRIIELTKRERAKKRKGNEFGMNTIRK
jgi:hypothetical protein